MALTKVMANEGGEHNILVNALLIDLIMSDQQVKRHAAQAPNMDFDEFAKGGRLAASARRKSSPTSPASSLRVGLLHHRTAINVDGGRSPLV